MHNTVLRLMTTGALVLLVGAIAIPTPCSAESPHDAAVQSVEQVEINSATVEDLQRVPGIGPTLAARIVDFRQEHGPFGSVEDLLNVQGIGVKTLERMRPYLKVEVPKSEG